ncbi:Aste57867_10772 [Aphanomyces stellatus]|uniref:Aste57867_10772 protein n=1 Tax=Aphanomyces stellatus TaxID=120398 RepID=A0A485KR82_9STRA|nr:hypothetical protein As57867_010732 [Aphanomyces stellatus]VFT87642.1 Aste57867_10772 [Aphanomyces stellatus]
MFGRRVWTTRLFSSRISIPVRQSGGTTPRKRSVQPLLRPEQFNALSATFLDRVEQAIEPLHPPMNEVFRVTRASNPDSLTIALAAHEFTLQVLGKRQKIELVSPISGSRTYIYNTKTTRWEDETDAHDIEGLLTRDLMRLCSGVPGF